MSQIPLVVIVTAQFTPHQLLAWSNYPLTTNNRIKIQKDMKDYLWVILIKDFSYNFLDNIFQSNNLLHPQRKVWHKIPATEIENSFNQYVMIWHKIPSNEIGGSEESVSTPSSTSIISQENSEMDYLGNSETTNDVWNRMLGSQKHLHKMRVWDIRMLRWKKCKIRKDKQNRGR